MKNKALLKCAINAGCKSVRDFARFIKENSSKDKHSKKVILKKQQLKKI